MRNEYSTEEAKNCINIQFVSAMNDYNNPAVVAISRINRKDTDNIGWLAFYSQEVSLSFFVSICCHYILGILIFNSIYIIQS